MVVLGAGPYPLVMVRPCPSLELTCLHFPAARAHLFVLSFFLSFPPVSSLAFCFRFAFLLSSPVRARPRGPAGVAWARPLSASRQPVKKRREKQLSMAPEGPDPYFVLLFPLSSSSSTPYFCHFSLSSKEGASRWYFLEFSGTFVPRRFLQLFSNVLMLVVFPDDILTEKSEKYSFPGPKSPRRPISTLFGEYDVAFLQWRAIPKRGEEERREEGKSEPD